MRSVIRRGRLRGAALVERELVREAVVGGDLLARDRVHGDLERQRGVPRRGGLDRQRGRLGGGGFAGSAAGGVEPAATEPMVVVPWIVCGPPVRLKLTPTPFSSTLPPL